MADEDFITVKIEGLAELQAKLNDLGTKAADKAMRKALKAGAAIEQAAISERAPVKVKNTGGILPPGALKNDIVSKIVNTDGGMYAVVGPDKLTFHVAGWVEYGHRIVQGGYSRVLPNGKTRGPGKQTGEVEAHPFIRPAFEASQQEVTDTIISILGSEIENAAGSKGSS